MAHDHVLDHLADRQRFARIALHVARLEPVEAAQGVVAAPLLGQQHRKAVAVGKLRPAGAVVVGGCRLGTAVEHDDQPCCGRKCRRNVAQHAQIAGIGAEIRNFSETARPLFQLVKRLLGLGGGREELLPRAAVAPLARQAGEIGEVAKRRAEFKHGSFPFLRDCRKSADGDQLARWQKNTVKQAGIGSAAPVGIKPCGGAAACRHLVALGQNAAPAVRPARNLHGSDGKAAADPDAKQLLRKQGACPAVAGVIEQMGERGTEGKPSGEERYRRTIFGRCSVTRRANADAGCSRIAGKGGRLQSAIAADRIDGVALLRRRHDADEKIGGVVGRCRRRAWAAWAGRNKPLRDHERDTEANIAPRQIEDLGKPLTELIPAHRCDHRQRV